MRREYGSFHLVPPGWDGSADDAHTQVVETYRYGPSYIELAVELAKLAGDDARSQRLQQAMDRGFERDHPVLDEHDIRDLLEGIEGLEELVRARLLGSDGLLPPERIEDLRSRSKYMDLDEDRGSTVAYAGLDAMSRVSALRDFLLDARARGMNLAMD